MQRRTTALACIGLMLLSAGCSSPAPVSPASSSPTTTSAGPVGEPTGESAETAGATETAGLSAGSLIGVALPTTGQLSDGLDPDAISQALSDAGFTVQIEQAADAAGQVDQIRALLDAGVKALVIDPLPANTLADPVLTGVPADPLVEAALLGSLADAIAAGVWVIALDQLIRQTPNIDLFVGFDPALAGQLGAQALLDAVASTEPAQPWGIEIIGGAPNDPQSRTFVGGAMTVLEPLLDDGTVDIGSGGTTFAQVATQGGSPEAAELRFINVIADFYDEKRLDGVLGPTDALANVGATAAAAKGRPAPVIVGGTSQPEGIERVATGQQYATTWFDPALLADALTSAIAELATGAVPVTQHLINNSAVDLPAAYVAPTLITTDNVCTTYPPGSPQAETAATACATR